MATFKTLWSTAVYFIASNNSFVHARMHFLSHRIKSLRIFYGFCCCPILETVSSLMSASSFRKRHKQRKAHDDHNVISDTAIVVGTSFLCACAERREPSCHFFLFRFRCQPIMSPDEGHGERTISVCHVFSIFKPSFSVVARWSDGRKDRFQTNAPEPPHDRKPCSHDNDGRGTSVTAAGKRRFPFVRCVALSIFQRRVASPHTLYFFSFPPLHMYDNVPMPSFQTTSVVIYVAEQR